MLYAIGFIYYLIGILAIPMAAHNEACRERFAKRHSKPLGFFSVLKLLAIEPLRWPVTIGEVMQKRHVR